MKPRPIIGLINWNGLNKDCIKPFLSWLKLKTCLFFNFIISGSLPCESQPKVNLLTKDGLAISSPVFLNYAPTPSNFIVETWQKMSEVIIFARSYSCWKKSKSLSIMIKFDVSNESITCLLCTDWAFMYYRANKTKNIAVLTEVRQG